ncbi:hypothetical protein VNO77_14918 [Canavalia gladiata]|uniref:Uncharacterized protein n=1 Tax=Canavalia gladiata TaxID=3824 RepID=A0AAN9QS57_CANGL
MQIRMGGPSLHACYLFLPRKTAGWVPLKYTLESTFICLNSPLFAYIIDVLDLKLEYKGEDIGFPRRVSAHVLVRGLCVIIHSHQGRYNPEPLGGQCASSLGWALHSAKYLRRLR